MINNYGRELQWNVGNNPVNLVYYPTKLELILENFAQKNDSSLSPAKDDFIYCGPNYSRSLTKPINEINLEYVRLVWEGDYDDKEISNFIPSVMSSFKDILNHKTATFHMRNLHDSSIYTEQVEIKGDNIFLQMEFNKGKSKLYEVDEFFLSHKEFNIFGKNFTDKTKISNKKLSEKIIETSPLEVVNLLVKGIENYK